MLVLLADYPYNIAWAIAVVNKKVVKRMSGDYSKIAYRQSNGASVGKYTSHYNVATTSPATTRLINLHDNTIAVFTETNQITDFHAVLSRLHM